MTDRTATAAALAARGIDPARLDALEEGIRYALNGPYLAIQVAIGQDDGGIASMYASGREDGLASSLAGRMVSAGWDGKAVPTWIEADHPALLPDGETVPASDLGRVAVEKASGDFLVSLARQAGLAPYETFRTWDRDDVVRHFEGYLQVEAAYAAPSP